MNEEDLQKTDNELEKLLCSCEDLRSQMAKEHKKYEYFILELLSQRMKVIRGEIRLIRNLLDFWDKVRGTKLEVEYLRFANYYFKSLNLDLNVEILYLKSLNFSDYQVMEIYYGWIKICRFYDDYYARKILSAYDK